MKNISIAAILCFGALLVGCNSQQNAEAGNAARKAQTEIGQATDKAKHDLTDGAITVKLKSAMQASDKLNTSGINVDTKDKVAHLRGSVPDSNQRALAKRIAKDTVGSDVKVVNELVVNGSKAAKK